MGKCFYMKKILIALLIAILVLPVLISPQPAFAAGKTYYVATNGNNSNPGTLNSPWKTIQKAANVARAGDTVYVRGGTYREKVNVNRSGSAGNFITFSSYPGETAVIDVNGIAMEHYLDGGFVIFGKSYVQVTGFRVINSNSTNDGGFGIVCVESHHCIIKNNSTYNTYHSGIISRSSSNVIIDGNEVELANNGGDQEMITISGGSFVTVSNNHVHHGGLADGGEGIDVKNGAHDVLIKGNHVYNNQRLGIYIDAYNGNSYNITVDGNRVYNNARSGIAISAELSGYNVNNVNIINNLVYSNGTSGIVLGDWGTGSLSNITIANNTVFQNGIGNGHGGIALWAERASDVIVRNNIVSQNEAFTIEVQGTPLSETTITNNLLHGYRNAENEVTGTKQVMSNPLFVNSSAADFTLQATSPAINAGTSANAPDHDFDGSARPYSANWDIGAFEFTGEVPVPTTFFSNNFNTTFNNWKRVGKIIQNGATPTIGSKSIKFSGNAYMQSRISTAGYSNLTLVIYLGGGSYESLEQLKLTWWDGSAWHALTSIKNNTARENGKLNKLIFNLPEGASDNPSFILRIQQLKADAKDFGFVDEIKLIGTLR
jgi:hypothetical protein